METSQTRSNQREEAPQYAKSPNRSPGSRSRSVKSGNGESSAQSKAGPMEVKDEQYLKTLINRLKASEKSTRQGKDLKGGAISLSSSSRSPPPSTSPRRILPPTSNRGHGSPRKSPRKRLSQGKIERTNVMREKVVLSTKEKNMIKQRMLFDEDDEFRL